MTNTVHDYLQRLDAALGPVPYVTAREIRAGVEEELLALDAAAADERMRELGDPADIAAAASGSLRETPSWAADGATAPPWQAAPPARASGTASPVYVVLTTLAIGVGLWVVPVVGWIAGIVLLWSSVVWRRWEKILATAVPVGALGLLVVVTMLTPRIDAQATSVVVSGSGGEFHAPRVEEYGAANPFLPSGFDLFWSGALGIAALCFASGVWLLVVAFRRGLEPVSPRRGGRSGDPLVAVGAAMLVTGLFVFFGSLAVFANLLTAWPFLVLAVAGLALLVVRAVTRR